jgi:hypothetical protein
VSARSYVSEADLWLAIADSHNGDWAAARESSGRAIEICEALETIGAAIKEGYRDRVALRTDPDFGPFRCAPAYASLLAFK